MDIDVFVSHHTDSSLHIVEAIVNRLESNGIRCWYAPRDTEGDYAGSIVKAINNCTVFLLILNKQSSNSVHVLNELNMVTERLSKQENVSIIPFHTADNEISDQARYYIGRMHWIDAMKPSMLERIDELVERITGIFGHFSNNSKPVSLSQYTLVSKIPPVRDVFIGRENLIQEIRSFFESGQRVLFLEGIGGIGKSELAKQYALKYRSDYKTIVFATYSENLQSVVCDADKIEISDVSMYPDETTEDFFKRKLKVLRSITDKNTLLIIDNFDVDYDNYFEEFIEGSCDIIITTRNAHPGFSTIKVNAIDNTQQLLMMFERHYGMALSEEDKPFIEKLFELVEYHTYAIELLANQMETSFLSGQELYEIFTNKSLSKTSDECFRGRDRVDTAFGHIRRLFSVSGLNKMEKTILTELSLFSVSGIPAKVYWSWSSSDNISMKKQAVMSLIKKSWVRRSNNEYGQILSLHPLVTEVICSDTELRPTTINCRGLLLNLSLFIYRAWFRTYKENLAIGDGVLSIEDYFSPFEFDPDDREIFCLFSYMPNFLWQIGKFDESIRYGRIFFDTCLSICGEKSMLTGYAAKMLAGCYFNSGHEEESIEWYKKGLEYMLGEGKETEDLAMSYEKVARCYSWPYEQDLKKSEELFLTSDRIRTRIMNSLHENETAETVELHLIYDSKQAEIRIGENYMEMGRMFQIKKDYQQALQYTEKYADVLKRLEPDNLSGLAYAHYDKGISYYNIGLSYCEADKTKAEQFFKLAESELKSALETNMRMRGGLAVDTIDNQEALGDVYTALGKIADGANCYLAALSMTERLLGSDSKRIENIKRKMNSQ